jgi:hypothetical protein
MSNFANVYIGVAPNDRTGDPIRNAFDKINHNFANINIGTVSSGGVTSVAGRVGNVVLAVNDVLGAASIGYVNNLLFGGGRSVYANTVGSFGTDLGIGPNYASNNPAVLFSKDDLTIRTGGTAAAGGQNRGQMNIAASESLYIGRANHLADAAWLNTDAYTSYINFDHDGNVYINANSGVTNQRWTFGQDSELYLPTGGRLGVAGKGWTGLDGGFGNPLSLTSYYSSGMYASCITLSPNGTLTISTYGDGTGQLGNWTFAGNTLTLPNSGLIDFNSPYTRFKNTVTGQGAQLGSPDDQNYVNVDNTAVTIQVNSDGVGGPHALPQHNWIFGQDGTIVSETGRNITGELSGQTDNGNNFGNIPIAIKNASGYKRLVGLDSTAQTWITLNDLGQQLGINPGWINGAIIEYQAFSTHISWQGSMVGQIIIASNQNTAMNVSHTETAITYSGGNPADVTFTNLDLWHVNGGELQARRTDSGSGQQLDITWTARVFVNASENYC